MKTLLSYLFLLILPVSQIQAQLNSTHNHFRSGDVLIKQQVDFVDPGQEGSNKLWDFSKLKTINQEYTLSYAMPPIEGDSVYIMGDSRYQKKDFDDNDLIVGTEHNTMYYFLLRNDTLIQLGHENPTVRLMYTSPFVLMPFPLNYGQSVSSGYITKGLYSATVDMQSRGEVITRADAYGSMILPSGDTISPVLRVKTQQTIIDMLNRNNENQEEAKGNLLETCRWYTKGYRYPIFETVTNISLADNTPIFSTAFFFPPQDHLYLDTDPDNMALLDELWDMDKDQTPVTTSAKEGKTVTIEDLVTCRIYPNPVKSLMNMEYELKTDADISFDLYTLEGLPVMKINRKKHATGLYQQTIDCSNLKPRSYVLKITVNNLTVNEIIIKK